MSTTFCPEEHARKSNETSWFIGSNGALGVWIGPSGMQIYKVECRRCGYRTSALPHAQVDYWLRAGVDIEWTESSADRYGPRDRPPCGYAECTNTVTQLHHYAPRNTFGADDADNWPVGALCQDHHRQWHQVMDGYRWHRKSVTR